MVFVRDRMYINAANRRERQQQQQQHHEQTNNEWMELPVI